MKRFWQYIVCIMIVCTLIISISACDGTSATAKSARHERFVQVDAELICPDYDLGIHMFLNDGRTKQESYDACYLVDRVSRYVYIHIYDETGAYSSGMMILECKDADGNHMRYEGEQKK